MFWYLTSHIVVWRGNVSKKPVSICPDEGVSCFLRNVSFHTRVCLASQRGRQNLHHAAVNCSAESLQRAKCLFMLPSWRTAQRQAWDCRVSVVGLEAAAIVFKVQVAWSFESSVNFYPNNGIALMKTARFIGQCSDFVSVQSLRLCDLHHRQHLNKFSRIEQLDIWRRMSILFKFLSGFTLTLRLLMSYIYIWSS